jgi:hypothetical protein
MTERTPFDQAVEVATDEELDGPDPWEPPASRWFPDVQGHCPACGGESLMLADGGYVTCRRLDCPDPESAHKAIEEHAGANAYGRAITAPPSAEACAAIRARVESDNPPRRKVRGLRADDSS